MLRKACGYGVGGVGRPFSYHYYCNFARNVCAIRFSPLVMRERIGVSVMDENLNGARAG